MTRAVSALRDWWKSTRPVSDEAREVLSRRWDELPGSSKTPAQVLGRHSVGCEGTHGVFPQCNLTCKPCYHSADANKVRIDAEHTLREVDAQMAYLREVRGPRGHAQLIGGEVTLLDADTHAEALGRGTVLHSCGQGPGRDGVGGSGGTA